MEVSTVGSAVPVGVRRVLTGRGALLCGITVVAVVVQAQLRSPIGVPGHRGLVWLTLLVAVLLFTGSPTATAAVGLSSAGVIAALGLGPHAAVPPAAAAMILAAVASASWVRRRSWVVALLAAPVHLVALVVPLHRDLTVGTTVHPEMGSMVTLLLLFGLAAGLAGWGLARFWAQGGSHHGSWLEVR
jgi:hypothetical protein